MNFVGILKHLYFHCQHPACKSVRDDLEHPLKVDSIRDTTQLAVSSDDTLLWERGLVPNPMLNLRIPLPSADVCWEFGIRDECDAYLDGTIGTDGSLQHGQFAALRTGG